MFAYKKRKSRYRKYFEFFDDSLILMVFYIYKKIHTYIASQNSTGVLKDLILESLYSTWHIFCHFLKISTYISYINHEYVFDGERIPYKINLIFGLLSSFTVLSSCKIRWVSFKILNLTYSSVFETV